MFTGIIQDIGIVESIYRKENSLTMTISTNLETAHLSLGASISCNGCCLTVVESFQKSNKNNFVVDIGFQSLALTNFANLKEGSSINLEPALRVGDSIGGHHLTGHIDYLAKIENFKKINDEFWKLGIYIPQRFCKWMVPKGSIGVVGISLTIANILAKENNESLVEIMIIPHTFKMTTLPFYASQMSIEIEFDQTVKAIASVVETMLPNYIQARK